MRPGRFPAPEARVVSDLTSLAVLGLVARQFKAFLRTNGIPHCKVGRRTLAKTDDVLAVIDRLTGAPSSPGPGPGLTEAEAVELAVRPRLQRREASK